MQWLLDQTSIDWAELSNLYRIAPLGNANPGKEGFYKKLGFLRMRTAMAIFQNQEQAIRGGLLDDT
jgi:hypothetical protein